MHDGKAQTGAAGLTAAGLIDTVEAVEDGRERAFGDAGAGILDVDDDGIVRVAHAHVDAAALAIVFDAVFDEIEQDLIGVVLKREDGAALFHAGGQLDGLAVGVSAISTASITVIALMVAETNVAVVLAALFGACLGFIPYNMNPAKIFMGDTGSLFLGGTVAALAFAYDMPLVLIPVGFVYICETLSDILQVIYFKATHGKRLFKMAPLHHHFELCGWSEVKLVAVFTSVSALCCLAALFGVLNRFHF